MWEPGTLFPTALGELPGGGENAATAVNSAGTIIVGVGEIPGADGHAVRWVNFNGTWIVQDLGTVEFGGTRAMANDIADDGTIVGVEGGDSFAHAINTNGQVVGMSRAGGAERGTLWTMK